MVNSFKRFLKSSKIGRILYGPIGYLYTHFYKDAQRKRAMKAYATSNLRYIIEIAQKEGVCVIPAYGTLLGFIREGDFMKHDYDIDLALAPNTDAKRWAQNLVEKYGFKFDQGLSYKGVVCEFAVEYNGLRTDFFFTHESEDKLRIANFEWHNDEPYTDPRQNSLYYVDFPQIGKLKTVNIRGIEVPIPENSEDWMYAAYGPGWRIPDPTWTIENGCPGYVPEEGYGYSFTYKDLMNNNIL